MVPEMVIKSFSLFKQSCLAALRGIFIVINTWVDILCAAIYVHISIFWRFVVWTVCLITLPTRVLTALQREKELEMHLHGLQNRLDALAWDRKELQERLKMAIRERDMMELMLGELEDEHDQAINKIVCLENELQNLKDENHRLKEVHNKTCWGACQNLKDGFLPPKGNHNKTSMTLTDILMHEHAFDDTINAKIDARAFDIEPLSRHTIRPNDVLGQRREIALSQSLFSALLSLVVGMTIWEAEEPCMPLVLALFMVVGMSLKSVVEFFYIIKNKPASDAVALLSFNLFVLGTLTYPTLPRIARFVAPFFANLLGRAVGRFVLSFEAS